ncbi:hypothetical protein T439DRAFT_355678 [Meredithblackwellia eburnea MCA 4105]
MDFIWVHAERLHVYDEQGKAAAEAFVRRLGLGGQYQAQLERTTLSYQDRTKWWEEQKKKIATAIYAEGDSSKGGAERKANDPRLSIDGDYFLERWSTLNDESEQEQGIGQSAFKFLRGNSNRNFLQGHQSQDQSKQYLRRVDAALVTETSTTTTWGNIAVVVEFTNEPAPNLSSETRLYVPGLATFRQQTPGGTDSEEQPEFELIAYVVDHEGVVFYPIPNVIGNNFLVVQALLATLHNMSIYHGAGYNPLYTYAFRPDPNFDGDLIPSRLHLPARLLGPQYSLIDTFPLDPAVVELDKPLHNVANPFGRGTVVYLGHIGGKTTGLEVVVRMSWTDLDRRGREAANLAQLFGMTLEEISLRDLGSRTTLPQPQPSQPAGAVSTTSSNLVPKLVGTFAIQRPGGDDQRMIGTPSRQIEVVLMVNPTGFELITKVKSPSVVLGACREVLDLLLSAYTNCGQLLHRDISSGNILVNQSTGRPLVIDWECGSSASTAQTNSLKNVRTGTMDTMSVAVLSKQTHTFSADVESLIYVVWKTMGRHLQGCGIKIGEVSVNDWLTFDTLCLNISTELLISQRQSFWSRKNQFLHAIRQAFPKLAEFLESLASLSDTTGTLGNLSPMEGALGEEEIVEKVAEVFKKGQEMLGDTWAQ